MVTAAQSKPHRGDTRPFSKGKTGSSPTKDSRKQSKKSGDITLAAATCPGSSGAEPQTKAGKLKGREGGKMKNKQGLLVPRLPSSHRNARWNRGAGRARQDQQIWG